MFLLDGRKTPFCAAQKNSQLEGRAGANWLPVFRSSTSEMRLAAQTRELVHLLKMKEHLSRRFSKEI
jgi:hypothetical protein